MGPARLARRPARRPTACGSTSGSAHGRLTTVKTGPHRVVYRVDLPEGAVYVKHFLVPDFRAMVRQWFRRGKGRNEGRRPASSRRSACRRSRRSPWASSGSGSSCFENYLVTQAIPETVPLDEFVERRLPQMAAAAAGAGPAEPGRALAVLTARLHDAGFVHQDFHPGNILVRIDDDDAPSLAMIDLDALRVTPPARLARRRSRTSRC